MTKHNKKWTYRNGRMTSLVVKTGRNGPYAAMEIEYEIDGKKHIQTATAFSQDVIEKAKAAGNGSNVWIKGPIKTLPRKNGNHETQITVMLFKDRTADLAEKAKREAELAEIEAAKAIERAHLDLVAIDGIGPSIATKLVNNNILTYTQLSNTSRPALDSIKAGLGKLSITKKWHEQASRLANQAAEIAEQAKLDAQIAF